MLIVTIWKAKQAVNSGFSNDCIKVLQNTNVLTSFQKEDIMAKFVIALLVLVAVYAAEGKVHDQIIST